MALLPKATRRAERAAEALVDADAAIVVTEWPEYLGLVTPEVADSMKRPLLVDGRNLLDAEAASAAGFEWLGIGRPAGFPQRVTRVGTAQPSPVGRP